MSSIRVIPTEAGEARLHADRSRYPTAALALGHGAGRGVDSPDLVALATALPRHGISVFRIEQPWVVAGRKVAPRPAILDVATIACLNAIRVRTPLVIGGRSAGARSACRVGRSMGAVGCLALAFPLHPPGRTEPSRLSELCDAGLPTLVVQGERDALGTPDEFPESIALAVIPEADHGFAVPRKAALDQEQTLALVVEAVLEWVTARIARPTARNGG
ncbi:MAG: alpha/beta hydrolase family protein [Nocardioidaceae bacterium]